MAKEYVELRNGGHYIKGTRVSLDSVVYAFKRGAAPETIKRSFPVLTLEEVYGAITFYLAHEAEIDEYLQHQEIEFSAQTSAERERLRTDKPELFERIVQARKESKAPQP